jgi:hypothetical protein
MRNVQGYVQGEYVNDLDVQHSFSITAWDTASFQLPDPEYKTKSCVRGVIVFKNDKTKSSFVKGAVWSVFRDVAGNQLTVPADRKNVGALAEDEFAVQFIRVLLYRTSGDWQTYVQWNEREEASNIIGAVKKRQEELESQLKELRATALSLESELAAKTSEKQAVDDDITSKKNLLHEKDLFMKNEEQKLDNEETYFKVNPSAPVDDPEKTVYNLRMQAWEDNTEKYNKLVDEYNLLEEEIKTLIAKHIELSSAIKDLNENFQNENTKLASAEHEYQMLAMRGFISTEHPSCAICARPATGECNGAYFCSEECHSH